MNNSKIFETMIGSSVVVQKTTRLLYYNHIKSFSGKVILHNNTSNKYIKNKVCHAIQNTSSLIRNIIYLL